MQVRRLLGALSLVAGLAVATSTPASAQTKLAQTGFQFLSIGADARAMGLAGAMTTSVWGSGAMFFNPAGMARMPSTVDLAASQNRWIADITHNAFTVALGPAGGALGVFGLSLFTVDYGEVDGTMVWANEQGYIDTEVLRPSAIALGVGYARAISDRFSVGGHLKYVGQHLGESIVPSGDSLLTKKNLAFATAFDFGTLFNTGFRSLTFGMSVRNFSNEIEFEEESFQLPLTFRIGLSINLFEFLGADPSSQDMRLYLDASHPRDAPEQVNVGAEYGLWNTLFLRGGYLVKFDERGPTFGLGINLLGLAVDYAYTPFGVFDRVEQFTLRLSR